MHNLKGITFSSEAFVPTGCHSGKTFSLASSSVKIGAGVQWEELYKAAFENNKTVAGGQCTSVGAAGGHPQGGGHSQMSPSFGMVADNILEYEVVKADGSLVVANKCQNQKLFWALRGGGGGTYGVVTSATYATYPALTGLVFANYVITTVDRPSFEHFLAFFLSTTPSLTSNRWGGVFIFGNQSLSINFLLPNHNLSFAESTFSTIFSYVQSKTLNITGNMQNYASYYEWHMAAQCSGGKCGFPSGFVLLEASRLIPRKTIEQSSHELATTLLGMYDGLAENLLRFAGYMVAGGAVSKFQDNAVNPAWRKAVVHLLVVKTVTNDTQVEFTRNQLTSTFQSLRSLTPESGTYMNEGDINEPNWQESYFGTYYLRLKLIKKAVDPTGLFICRHCVGSENWSEDLNCRL